MRAYRYLWLRVALEAICDTQRYSHAVANEAAYWFKSKETTIGSWLWIVSTVGLSAAQKRKFERAAELGLKGQRVLNHKMVKSFYYGDTRLYKRKPKLEAA